MKKLLPFLLILLAGYQALSQEDSTDNRSLETVVVTATRSERALSSLPMPVMVIDKKQIQQMGSMRLGDVLAEQTGLFIVNDHGKGVQLQGFNPDYTLILVDGEPLIGRTAGTLELDRLAVGNIKQIEVVKGPSSSLYGSEALAGVINIITEDANKTGGTINARYGANQTSDLSFNGNLKAGDLKLNLFADRYASGGYDLTPETYGNTVAPFVNYTVQPKLKYQISDKTSALASARYYTESQNDGYEIASSGDTPTRLLSDGKVEDQNYNLRLKHSFTPTLNVTARAYYSSYVTNSLISYETTGDVYDQSYFNQSFLRPELLVDFSQAEKHFFLFGIGSVLESVEATRYDELKTFNTNYIFGQYEWYASERWQLNLGGRYDAHSAYRNQFSPKAAAIFSLNDHLKIRGSYGVGYKAPDFRQLYLNFTNAIAGYSVFGSNELLANLNKLQAEGQITAVFQDPQSFGDLSPESSQAFNLGVLLTAENGLSGNLNAFRNDVQDLIESFPVAQKANGQNLYSYRNISEVYTQGLEANVSYPMEIGYQGKLRLSAGYQFLEAKDKSVIEAIKEGNLYKRDPETLETTRVSKADYGGLINRSKHSANVKAFYQIENGLSFNIRGIYRGRYGFADLNGNEIIDADNEYAKGYFLMNIASAYETGIWRFQAGVDNVLNFRDAIAQPGIAGLQWWVRSQITF